MPAAVYGMTDLPPISYETVQVRAKAYAAAFTEGANMNSNGNCAWAEHRWKFWVEYWEGV